MNSPAPIPVTEETLAAGAGETPPICDASDPLKVVQSAVSRLQAPSLLELAEIHFGTPQIDGNGERRKQPQTEIIVLAIEHFRIWLKDLELGAGVLNGLPHLFGGTHWKPIDDNECSALLGGFAEQLGYQIVESRIFTFREKLLKQYYSELAGKPGVRESDCILVNFSNGTLEFVNGVEVLRAFRKDDALTYQLPFGYDQTAICPMFDRYLERVLPDPSSRNLLAEFLGWIFLRDLKLEKVLVLLGDGHNGKSVFFDIVNSLLGSYNVSNLGLSTLAKPENRLQLGSTLLNFGSEISTRCDPELFKRLASGEPIEARRLYRDLVTLRSYARMAFNANSLPQDIEHTTGFFRRFLIVPFNQTISDEEKDPDLARKIIKAELPGVFNWVMKGLRRLREQRRFSDCAESANALATYQKERDSVAMFLEDEGFTACNESRIGKDDLYKDYRQYCQSSGYNPLCKNNFGKRLSRTHRVRDSKSGGCRYWHLSRPKWDE